jgi:hypothetical protein
MEDAELEVLQKAHGASGKLLQGKAITAAEEQALGQVVRMIEPVLAQVRKSHVRDLVTEISEPRATRWTPAAPMGCRPGGGRFFR